MTNASDWTGTVGNAWAAEWRRTDRSLADLSRHLDRAILAAAADRPFAALDVGCGAGTTSLALAAARPDATVTGIDLSAELIAIARGRASEPDVLPRRREPRVAGEDVGSPELRLAREHIEAREGIAFHVADAATDAGRYAPVDLICSRHGVMFFDDPVTAFADLRAAGRPGAALIFSCFAGWADNAFARLLAEAVGAPPPDSCAPGPFAFADRDRVAVILAAAGWRDARAVPTPFTYRAGAGENPEGDALAFFERIGPAASALRAVALDDRARLIDRVAAVIADHRTGDAIDFPASAWIWSAKA